MLQPDSFENCDHGQHAGTALFKMRFARRFEIRCCSNCGVLYTAPMPKEETLRKLYVETSDEEAQRTYVSTILPSRLVSYRLVLDRLSVFRQSDLLLDVGCGYGDFLELARGHGWEATGIELSSHELDVARQRGLEVKRSTLEEATFPSAYFDVVSLWDVVEHLPDPVAALRECYRIMRPGGGIVVRVPNAQVISDYKGPWRSPVQHLYILGAYPLVPSQHLYHYRAIDIAKLLKHSYFEVLELLTDEPLQARLVRSRHLVVSLARQAIAYAGWKMGLPFETIAIARKPG